MTSKHPHAEIFKAYLDNTDICVLINHENESKWLRTNPRALFDYQDQEFFACLPKHKEACLHRLNGGEVQIKYNSSNNWCDCTAAPDKPTWGHDHIFMDEFVITRIKPKKEKRWIIAKPHSLASMMYFETEKQARDAIDRINKFEGSDRHGGQAIEIEIEV